MRPGRRKEQNSESSEDEGDTGSEEFSDDEEDLHSSIWSTLQKLKTPVAFAFSTVSSSLPNPGIQILHHGVIGLPLSTDDAKKIISQSSASPFGRGEETVIDESVRRCWELNPTQFSLENPEWKKAVEIMLDSVSLGLGISVGTGKISAELHKLLLYESGAFFKPHKDSEKVQGMFGTLVVCLPSQHEGGKLILTHDGEKYEFETAKSSRFNTSYTAFYADITHEVLPIISGYRLILVYNLSRQSDFVVPSYNLARGHVRQLSSLLQTYDMEAENEATDLPPILLHKLKHKYTQANLTFSLLKPQDLTQVLTLRKLSVELGFDIYLATLELEINKDDEDDVDVEKSLSLKNIVDLDGNLVVDSLDCPDDALIDPTPQDEGEADEEDHQGFTGNAGSPVTYWYRDTVVILVPPSQQVDFAFPSSRNVIKSLFSKLMQKFSKDPAQKPKLLQLCERAMKQSLYAGTIPLFFQQASATVLDLEQFELFAKASTKTNYKIMLALDIPQKLGHWAAKKGLAALEDQLSKGVFVAPSIAEKVKFLESVSEGFKEGLQGLDSARVEDLKKWSNETLFSAIAQFTTLTKTDGVALGQLHQTTNWELFKSIAMPIIVKSATVVKIAFTNEFMSTLRKELNEEQKLFVQSIIQNIWKNFEFESVQQGDHCTSNSATIKSKINADDLHHIVENTIIVLPSEYVETLIIPAMITAIPKASKECSKELFLELVRMIIKNEQTGFRLPAIHAVPPASHKHFVQALLTKFLICNVGFEPQPPKNWSLPLGYCKCADCSVVNNFLKDPTRKQLDFQCSKARRHHLHLQFTDRCNSSYDVVTIRTKNPNVWRITKNQRGYEMSKSAWLKCAEIAIESLKALESDQPVNDKLKMYLQPYYNVIMRASMKELPALKVLVTTPSSSNDPGPAHNPEIDQTGETDLKRPMTDPQNHKTAKRRR